MRPTEPLLLLFIRCLGGTKSLAEAKVVFSGVITAIDQSINGPRFPLFSETELAAWSLGLARELSIESSKQLAIAPGKARKTESALYEFPLLNFLEAAIGIDQRVVQLHRLEIDSLGFMGVSAEITWTLREELAELLEGIVVVGLMRDTFGFVASTEQFLDGGNEGIGHQDPFSASQGRDRSQAALFYEPLKKTLR